MLCYRDMTFCDFWRTCLNAEGCSRKLTEKARMAAAEMNIPLCTYVSPPKECYLPNYDDAA